MDTEAVAGRGAESWGTWEELLLGGAVLRHGTQDWDLVAAELQARIICPFNLTSEACKAKYEDLQQKYSGCKALFEELRKQRMAELKRALEKSDDSIGSLESKLEVLKLERTNQSNIGCDSSRTESVAPFPKSDGGVETSSKETSKDGLSAGSFTQECWVPESTLVEDIGTKPDVSLLVKEEKDSGIRYLAETFSVRRRRGKRKRKDCRKEVKEGSVGESEFWGSADVLSATLCRENSATISGQTGRCSSVDDKSRSSNRDELPEIMRACNCIAENKCAIVFRRRLDSQKRGRYKRMIRQHMDFDTLRLRITSRAITSVKEMFRDMLLLANNALVFYSKTTREYKSAFLLREIVTNSLRENLKDHYISKTSTNTTVLTQQPMPHLPTKSQSIRPANQKVAAKVSKPTNSVANTPNAANQKVVVKVSKPANNVVKTPNPSKKTSNVNSPASAESLTLTKKASGRPRKTGQRPENTAKARKRGRAK